MDYGFDFVHGRLLLRKSPTGQFEPVNWDEAMQVFTLKFKALMDQHGPESVALLRCAYPHEGYRTSRLIGLRLTATSTNACQGGGISRGFRTGIRG